MISPSTAAENVKIPGLSGIARPKDSKESLRDSFEQASNVTSFMINQSKMDALVLPHEDISDQDSNTCLIRMPA